MDEKKRRGRPAWEVTPENYEQVRNYLNRKATHAQDIRTHLLHSEAKRAWAIAKFPAIVADKDSNIATNPSSEENQLSKEAARLNTWINLHAPDAKKKIASALRTENHRKKYAPKKSIDISSAALYELNLWKERTGKNLSDVILALCESIPERKFTLEFYTKNDVKPRQRHGIESAATYLYGTASHCTIDWYTNKQRTSRVKWRATVIDTDQEFARVRGNLREAIGEYTEVIKINVTL
ncbi:MAG: hypothetical protein GYB33_09755 [Gammaproteobacteria bacterium]|nr:hypothetical protein [Gammaproteobacteria bacterium]